MDRYNSDEARGDYKKETLWPEGKMPDRQPGQCEPYLEWHFPKVLKTRAIQIAYSGGAYDRTILTATRWHPCAVISTRKV